MIALYLIALLLILFRVRTSGNVRLVLTLILSLLPFFQIPSPSVSMFIICNMIGNIIFHFGYKLEPYTDWGIYMYGIGHIFYIMGNFTRSIMVINLISFVTVISMIIICIFFIMRYIIPELMRHTDTSSLMRMMLILVYIFILFLNGIVTAITPSILHVRGICLYILSDMMVSYSLYVGDLHPIVSLICDLLYYSSLLLMSS